MRKSILRDIRRSISLLLVFVLMVGIINPVGADANEGDKFYVHDKGRTIGILSCLDHSISNLDELENPDAEKLIGFKSKYIILEDAEEFDIEDNNSNNVDITADVFINIDGRNIKIISYEYPHNFYDLFYRENNGIFSDDSAVFMLRPVFYDDDGQKITYNSTDIGYHSYEYVIDAWYANQNYENTNGIYGLYPDFKNYMINKFGIDSVDSDKIVSFLSSAENEGKIYVSYTLCDGNNTAAVTYNDYKIIKYQTNYPESYGYVLNYSRIEDMTDYHERDEFDYLKMYKGDLYVDADEYRNINSSIALPNFNITGLSNMKSLEIGNDTVYNDNDEYIISTDSYNIGLLNYNNGTFANIFPEGLIQTMDDAMWYFLQVCYSEYSNSINEFEKFINGLGLNKEDYGDESKYNDAFVGWSLFADNYAAPVCIYKNGKQYLLTRGTKSGGMYDTFKFECYNAIELNDLSQGFFVSLSHGAQLYLQSFNLPSISLDSPQEGTLKESLTNYKNYLEELNGANIYFILPTDYGMPVTKYIKDLLEYPYYGEFKDDDKKNYTLDEVIDILDKCIRYMDESGNDYIDFEVLGNEYTNLMGFKQNFDDAFDLNGYKIDSSVAQNWVKLAGDYKIGETGVKIYAQKEDYGEEVIGSPDALMSYFKENDMITEFVKKLMLLQDNEKCISFERTTKTKKLPNNNSSVVVSPEQIQIPVNLLNKDLGADNEISRHYYMNDSFFIYMWEMKDNYDSNCEGTMLYHGVEKAYYYMRYNIGQYNNELKSNTRLLSYITPYAAIDALYLSELANLKFAKVPGEITARNDVYQTADKSIMLTWEKPEDNGAEIIGYQIAVVPKGTQIAKITDEDFYALSNLSYEDLGDNYVITYATKDLEYELSIEDTSKDVYIRAVNVIGPGPIKKITVNYEYEFRIIGPDEVYTKTTTNYDTVDFDNNNLEPFVIYSLKGNPDKVSIDSNGNLIVDKDCMLDSVVIISIGKKGTKYEGRRAEKTVRIIRQLTTEPNKTPVEDNPTENETTPNDTMGGDPPQTGDETNVNRFFVLYVLSGVVLIGGLMFFRKRKED